jgi:regulator of sirC expression with transglutaminase-like and TPR domain
VDTRKFAESQRQALETLLEDTSHAVRQALLVQFRDRGPEGAAFLRSLASRPDQQLAGHASWYLRELNLADPVSEFREFIRSLNYELETGALLLSRTVNADLDVGGCCSQLATMAARCRDLIAEPATSREKCRILNRVLFHEYGFRANAEDYADPLNSHLDQVLLRRKGIPISLSMVYLVVGERAGIPLEPVALPGHFVVGCYEETAPFFVDPFNAGLFLSAQEVFALIRGNNATPSIADLAPTPVREVLCRCCRNLVNHYTVAHQPEQAQLFASFVAEFESTHERHASS